MEYVCFGCGEKVQLEEVTKRIRCPFCGAKVLFKRRPMIRKLVKAR